MNDVLVPGWIKEVKAQEELEKAKENAAAQRAIAAGLLISSEGPEFWRQLLKELAINTDALPEIGLAGSTSPFGNPEGGEQRCRVNVSKPGAFPALTYTDLFYFKGDSTIRCHTLEQEVFSFDFAILPGNRGVGIVHENYVTPVTAEKAAEMIVKRMAKKVRN
jgi:hypothetical protein